MFLITDAEFEALEFSYTEVFLKPIRRREIKKSEFDTDPQKTINTIRKALEEEEHSDK